jgi:diguanylate cyclase (GGDEF)-like protein
MTHALLSGVARATTHRDRDELDLAVARLLMEFLDSRSTSVVRLACAGPIKQVECRVRLSRSAPGESPVCVPEPQEPAALVNFPAWNECVTRSEIVTCPTAHGSFTTLFPIRSEREVAGILVIETAAALATRETDLVVGILDILRNHVALLDYGELDTLTGLLNRKTFEGHFEKLRRRMIQPKSAPSPAQPARANTAPLEPSWLALIDIDHFKLINDGYGHLFGDEVLLLVSGLMKRSFRGADQLFRFGGEEFVVLLEHASEPGAQIAFERLRSSIEEYAFPQVGRVTVSVGYTRVNPQDVPTLCVERADAALYYAKTHGRNNVRSCEALIDAGELFTKSQAGDVELF